MKKYITIATLLAAGSAFANADTVSTTELDNLLLGYKSTDVWNVSFGSEYTNGYQVGGTLDSPGTFWDVVAVEGGTQTNGNKRVHMAGGVYGSWTDDFQFTITLTLGDPISASNNWPVFGELKGNSTSLRFGPYTGNNNTVAVDGNLTKTEGKNNLVSVASGVKYTVDLVKTGKDVFVYVNGDLTGAGTLADSVSGNITDIALGGDTSSNYRINETVHSVSYKTLTIPEPSTFGLLAGLGALALVGTRRRRK